MDRKLQSATGLNAKTSLLSIIVHFCASPKVGKRMARRAKVAKPQSRKAK
jgi:hypothetical protein